MTNHDTMLTQPSLTTTEIMTILLGCEQILRFVREQRDLVRSDKKRAMPAAGVAIAKNLFQYD